MIEIVRSKCGFGMTAHYTTRPFAIKVDGRFAMSASGIIRTFGSREAANKAARSLQKPEKPPGRFAGPHSPADRRGERMDEMSEGLQRATDSITVTIEFDGELIVLPITETMAARIETALKAGRSFYEVVEWDGVDTLVIHD